VFLIVFLMDKHKHGRKRRPQRFPLPLRSGMKTSERRRIGFLKHLNRNYMNADQVTALLKSISPTVDVASLDEIMDKDTMAFVEYYWYKDLFSEAQPVLKVGRKLTNNHFMPSSAPVSRVVAVSYENDEDEKLLGEQDGFEFFQGNFS
jgi:hypothetical protein